MSEKIVSVIKYEGGNQTLIYKHPEIDFNLGTQLIVHESQEAVFFRDGKALESFGPGRHSLETQNLPYLKEHINDLADGKHVFHSEVYFINLTTQLGAKWGTDSKINMFDPISGIHVSIGASGTFNLRVKDGRKLLIKVVGTTSGFEQEEIFGSIGYSTSKAIGLFKQMMLTKVKSSFAKAVRENDINVLELDEHLDELSEMLRLKINEVFDDYGIEMPEFYISNIVLPDANENPNFWRLKKQYGERFILAEQERIAQAAGRVELAEKTAHATAAAEATKIAGMAEIELEKQRGLAHAEVLKAQGGDYQAETARIVGKAAAENESSGAGSIASDIVKTGVGLGVGVAVAKEAVGTVKEMVNNTDSWVCPECGTAGLTTKFCPNCGHKRGE